MQRMKKMFRFNGMLVMIFSLQLFVMQSCLKDTANRNPEIALVAVNPETVYAFGKATLKIEASDPDKDKLTYSYQVYNGSIEGDGPTAVWTAPGAWSADTAIVIVNDGNGGEVRTKAYLNTQEVATQISGFIKIPSNLTGNLLYTRVSIYRDLASWLDNIPFQEAGIGDGGSTVAYNMVGVYYSPFSDHT
jgi:hypothetical protein